MRTLRTLYAMARADFLERVRRYAFLVTLAAAAWLGWLVVKGDVTLRLGDYVGQVNGAWAGALVAATISTVVSLAGFWIVKNAVQRDRDTRVGEILAATPLTRPAYTLGKFLSNLAVLSAIVAALAVVAPILVAVRGGAMDLVPMLTPFLLIALPSVAVVAALAVLFETVRPLSGGAGNVLWFFLWSALLAVPFAANLPSADMSGVLCLQQSMGDAARAVHPDYESGFSLSIGPGEDRPVRGTFLWTGLAWTPSLVASRLAWLGVAVLIALLAAIPFDRFRGDGTARFGLTTSRAPRVERTRGPALPLPSFLPAVYAGELRLMLGGRRVGWWAVVGALIVAGVATPVAISRGRILPFAWLWPVLVWSAMGARETRDGTEELVFTAPRPLARQLPSVYLAGVTVALLTASGVAIKCLATGSLGGLAGLLAGALFVPALALACGTWSGGSKLFEAIYVLIWYVGPLQPVPALDFMGASDLAVAAGVPLAYAAAAAALFAVAVAGRRWRMAR